MAHPVRILEDLHRGKVQMEQGLAGNFKTGFKFRLHDVVDPLFVEGFHLFHAFGPGQDFQTGVELPGLKHHGLGKDLGGSGNQKQISLLDLAASRTVFWLASP